MSFQRFRHSGLLAASCSVSPFKKTLREGTKQELQKKGDQGGGSEVRA